VVWLRLCSSAVDAVLNNFAWLAAGLCLFSFLQWRSTENEAQKVELFKAWERLDKQFPIFGQECDYHKFEAVVSKFHRNWREFSGCGRKMVRVVVADKGRKAPQSSRAGARANVSDEDKLRGESTPPTRGQSPETTDVGVRQEADAQITALLKAARVVESETAHCTTSSPDPETSARRPTGTFNVSHFLSPARTAETEASEGAWHHKARQAAAAALCDITLVHPAQEGRAEDKSARAVTRAPYVRKRPALSCETGRPMVSKKARASDDALGTHTDNPGKNGEVQDRLHALLDALSQ
jgi:hypothetical protein